MENINVSVETDNLYNSIALYSHMRQNLSAEDMPVILKNISNFFLDKLDTVKNLFGVNSERQDAHTIKHDVNVFVKDLYKLKDKAIKFSKNVQYSTVENISVPSVPGQTVMLPELCTNLQMNLQHINNTMYAYLDSLDNYIAQVIADKDFRESAKPQKPNDQIEKDENNAYKQLNQVVSSKKLTDTMKIKEMIPNISAIPACVETLYKIGNGITLENLKMIKERTKTITENITILQEDMKQDKEYLISKPVLNKLTKDLESTAKYITVGISYIYLYNQTVSVTQRLIETIDKVS